MTEFSIILKDACFLEGSRWVDGRLWVTVTPSASSVSLRTGPARVSKP